jgi:cell division protein FtsA
MVAQKHRVVASLDIGDSKIACLIGYVNAENKIYIKGYCQQKSQGIENGKITNAKSLLYGIIQTINIAERIAEIQPKSYYINIKNDLLSSNVVETENVFSYKKIKKSDIDTIYKYISLLSRKNNEEVIHIFPLQYLVNDEQVENVLSVINCNSLKITSLVVSMKKQQVLALKNVMKDMSLDIENFVSNGYANSLILLNEIEKKEGVLVLDIGSSVTNISFVYDNKFVFEKNIGFGGETFTKDISIVCRLNRDIAESVKILNSDFSVNGRDEENMIRINLDEFDDIEKAKFTIKDINDIIKTRLEEFLGVVFDILSENHFGEKLVKYIVLTGGTAQIPSIDDFVESVTGKSTRIGINDDINYINPNDGTTINELKKMTYNTAFGMLEFASKFKQEAPQKSIFLSILNKIFN